MSKPNHFKAKEFQLDTDKSNLSEITLGSRYPEKGHVLNTVSEMTVYVIEGKVSFNQKGECTTLDKGSVLLVKINQPYFWVPIDKVTLLIFSTPGWTLKQQRIIE